VVGPTAEALPVAEARSIAGPTAVAAWWWGGGVPPPSAEHLPSSGVYKTMQCKAAAGPRFYFLDQRLGNLSTDSSSLMTCSLLMLFTLCVLAFVSAENQLPVAARGKVLLLHLSYSLLCNVVYVNHLVCLSLTNTSAPISLSLVCLCVCVCVQVHWSWDLSSFGDNCTEASGNVTISPGSGGAKGKKVASCINADGVTVTLRCRYRRSTNANNTGYSLQAHASCSEPLPDDFDGPIAFNGCSKIDTHEAGISLGQCCFV
jgi:hypothetical protein